MRKAILTLLFASASSFGSADCKLYPKNLWMEGAELKSRLEAEGYTIKDFHVDGNCYEIYGKDKDGKKVEIYFDAKTGAPVKTVEWGKTTYH